MDDAAIVRGREAARDLDCRLDRLARRQRPPLVEALAQRLAFEQLGDDVWAMPPSRADVVDGEDVGMVHRGDRARFAFEPRQRFGTSASSCRAGS